ncbi:hypothetical protein E4U41_003984, partial [Claviceps citrina]
TMDHRRLGSHGSPRRRGQQDERRGRPQASSLQQRRGRGTLRPRRRVVKPPRHHRRRRVPPVRKRRRRSRGSRTVGHLLRHPQHILHHSAVHRLADRGRRLRRARAGQEQGVGRGRAGGAAGGGAERHCRVLVHRGRVCFCGCVCDQEAEVSV